MRDFTSDLTIMIAGTGKTNWANLSENLDDWVFGKIDDPDSVDKREVRIIFPILQRSGPALNLMTRYAMDKDADVQVVQVKGAPMNRDLSALPDIMVVENEHQALNNSFAMLKDRADAGDETVFLMVFDPESTYTQGEDSLSDLEILYEAKNDPSILTLNLDGMVDFFGGYESPQDKADREAKEAAFAEAKKAEQAALAPAPVKKATAPRKRAAKKAVAPKSIEAPVEPEKATESPSGARRTVYEHQTLNGTVQCSGPITVYDESLPADSDEPHVCPAPEPSSLDAFVAKKVEEQAAKKATQIISDDGLIDVDHRNPYPALDLVTTEDVWSDVAKAVSPWDTSRQDVLLVELGENIAEMGEAFSKTIRTMSELFKERNA